MCSCIPSPTNRSRATEISSGPRSSTTGLRRKKAAEKYSTLSEERTSGRAPLIVSTQRERKRVSSAKRPMTGSAMSPRSSETQNVEPSRIVSGTISVVPDDLVLARLLEGLDDDFVDHHVRRTREHPEDAISDVGGRQVIHAAIDGRLLLQIAS